MLKKESFSEEGEEEEEEASEGTVGDEPQLPQTETCDGRGENTLSQGE